MGKMVSGEKSFAAWAIKLDYELGLAGRYYFGNPPEFLEGCVTALFKTREIARRYYNTRIKIHSPRIYKTPHVVRVVVRIEEMKNGKTKAKK